MSTRLVSYRPFKALGRLQALVISRSLCASRVRFSSHDTVTHTGQVWEKDDFRNARFIERQKEVNTQFAIDLVDEEPPTVIKDSKFWCDGGSPGALGHPKVYINLARPGIHVCGYCGNRYVNNKYWEKMEKGEMEKAFSDTVVD
ncbi:NADH dehydrogenase [ubiquinone] iron-sulfur protein 6, mitochondrial-like [Corticium candelabrum]|uniref:NADH dehydrogenase [ubiquinone] iron-sulfur protein 6, mitochondrial-like n=1 Tax=Corticium candelabrum TaxID=121492 RepID=UPI002E2564A7|nr:NADH dehydrogenase [ubiquinone] iron-sulfur protein 6, mitochondrial-like [Corticium candelabrum]